MGLLVLEIALIGLFLVSAVAYGVAWWLLLDERSRRPGDTTQLVPDSVRPRALWFFMMSSQRALDGSTGDPRIRHLQRRVRMTRLLAGGAAIMLIVVQSIRS